MASHLGMSPREYLKTHTHREHLVWLEYLDQQMNEPNRTDYYLMQLTVELVRFMSLVVTHKNKNLTLEQTKIKFGRRQEGPLTKDQKQFKLQQSKSFWLGGLKALAERAGKKNKRHNIGPDGRVQDGEGQNKSESKAPVRPRIRSNRRPPSR